MLPLLGIILTIHIGATLGRVFWTQVAASNAIRDIRFKLYDHVQRLSLEFHSERPSGSIISRLMNDVATAQTSFDLLYIQAAQNICKRLSSPDTCSGATGNGRSFHWQCYHFSSSLRAC
jgi:ABC-type multidrug transport system fused ATPase/permease subunit